MSDADKYRASARDCLCKAEKAFYPEDKQAWMDMAARNDPGTRANAGGDV